MPALAAAYWSIRKDAAVGADGVTKDQYGQGLEQNLQDLYARLRSKRYRHQPIRRVHIPKDGGRTRPIGISALADKIVQSAVRHVLEAIYEQDCLDGSFGFRPGRRAQEAIRALDQVVFRGEVNWILEADIVSFFDSLDRVRSADASRGRGGLERSDAHLRVAALLRKSKLAPSAPTRRFVTDRSRTTLVDQARSFD